MLLFLLPGDRRKYVQDVFDLLLSELGPQTYSQLFPIILTDNGSSFLDPSLFEKERYEKAAGLFYKWGNEPVELIKFFRGEIDAAAGGRTEFQRGIMGMFGAVEKEIMGTTAQLRTSVTDIRRFF